jgi:hypothetical protein
MLLLLRHSSLPVRHPHWLYLFLWHLARKSLLLNIFLLLLRCSLQSFVFIIHLRAGHYSLPIALVHGLRAIAIDFRLPKRVCYSIETCISRFTVLSTPAPIRVPDCQVFHRTFMFSHDSVHLPKLFLEHLRSDILNATLYLWCIEPPIAHITLHATA